MQSSPQSQIHALQEQGYVVLPNFVHPDELAALNEASRREFAARRAPLEFEADLHYPGAPPSRSATGGETIRRLLNAYSRDRALASFATAPLVREWMLSYFGEPVLMSQAHHNCIMTKHPRYGSLTGWHRDARYWSFQRDDLVSVWLALGEERVDNGALWFVPRSHRMDLPPDQFDARKFFRADRQENAAIIETASSPHLQPGDAVLFHCNTLHAAGKNSSDGVKFSLVYTYHACSNRPLAAGRSASLPEISL